MYKYEIRKNPSESPVYPHTKIDHFIEIMEGPYEGVHFNFGPIQFMGEDEEGNGKINFDYNLLFLPENINLDEDRPGLEDMVGTTLQHVLETMVKNSEDNNETGTGDTESTTDG